MARYRRDLPVVAEPVLPDLPGELAAFRFDDWADPGDAAAHADAFGVMGEYLAAEARWKAALAEWADAEGLPLADARAAVTVAPSWEQHRQRLNRAAGLTVAGTSGSTQPNPTVIGASATDGGATWAYRSATAAVFKTMAVLGA